MEENNKVLKTTLNTESKNTQNTLSEVYIKEENCSDEDLNVNEDSEKYSCSINRNLEENPMLANYFQDTVEDISIKLESNTFGTSTIKQEQIIEESSITSSLKGDEPSNEEDKNIKFTVLNPSKLEKNESNKIQENKHVCEICNKKFKQKKYLSTHKKRFHLTNAVPVKPPVKITCDVCQKNFSDKHSLMAHTRIHTGYKAYVCDVCAKRFTYRSGLQDHARVHTAAHLLICDTCHKCFKQSSALRAHKKTHIDEMCYTCEQCDKKFSNRGNLNVHQRIHTGLRPYVCDVCDFAFNHVSAWKRHILLHTGQKSFACDFCKKSFATHDGLYHHKRIHNKHIESKIS